MSASPMSAAELYVAKIEQLGYRQHMTVNTLRASGGMWLIAQAVFDAKIEMLKKMVAEGYIMVDDFDITVEVNVGAHVIPAEATDGMPIQLPKNERYFAYYKKVDAPWLT